MRERRSFTRLVILALSAAPAAAQADDSSEELEWYDQRIHSDLPIYTFHYDELWPRRFDPEEEGVLGGCESRVSFGDWKFTPNSRNEYGDEWWLRVRNYGVFTCGALVYRAESSAGLDSADYDVSFFVRIGEEDADKPDREFWALQQGLVPGSDYILLSREVDEDFVIRFSVLQRRCPIGAYRSVMGMDSWRVGYCAINSHNDLLRLADEMAKLPPLGELEYAGPAQEPEK